MKDIKYVIDTNILLDNIDISMMQKCVILSHTLRELEKHKSSIDSLLAYKARETTRYILENREQFVFDLKNYGMSHYQDDNILEACLVGEYGLITNDILLRFRAEALDIPLININEYMTNSGDYTGFKIVKCDDEKLANFYENLDDNIFNLLINQYVIIQDSEGRTIDKFRWDGYSHAVLKLPPKKVIAPMNDIQSCALDLLYNKDIPIKIILGVAGSGKTMMAVSIGNHFVADKGQYAKLTFCRNPVGASSGEIGFLKGSFEDKTKMFMSSMEQYLPAGEQTAEFLKSRGMLECIIPYYMKGLTISESFIIADECEDLDEKLFKLLGTRVGNNSCIVFTGDFEQTEDKYKKKSGVKRAIRTLQNNSLVGIVVLQDDIRSDASRTFAQVY